MSKPIEYVHEVPDECDRITWRGGYIHLPLPAELENLRTDLRVTKQALESLKGERKDIEAENEALRKRIDDLSPFKNAPLTGRDLKCLACGGYHYGIGGLPCPKMRVTAQTDLPDTRSGQIGYGMEEGGQ